MLIADGTIVSPSGFSGGAAYAGLKTAGEGQRDVGVLLSDRPCAVAGVFTKSRFAAAPVRWCRDVVQRGTARALVVNSGNANAATGEEGSRDVVRMAALAGAKLGVTAREVLVCSTGVIGVRLPMDKVASGIEASVADAQAATAPGAGHEFARAMMTTDTFAKEIALEVLGGSIGGVAKGAGMIHPDMATLLAFVTTDLAVEPQYLQRALKLAADRSFNMVTIDGDTSTNDTLLLLANGAAGNDPLSEGSPQAAAFQEALDEVCVYLAKCVARDGEGATKLIEVLVKGAKSEGDARSAARTVAGSPLLKAAVYGSDPNLGRVLMAVGRSGAELDQDRTDVFLGPICFMKAGKPQLFDRDAARRLMGEKEVRFLVDLHMGNAQAVAWGCDLTEEYVRFNALYTT